MQSIIERITAALKEALEKEYGIIPKEPLRLAAPPDPEMGDFAFGCFPLAKSLKQAPKAIAQRLQSHLDKNPLFDRVEAAGPYLNLIVNRPELAQATLGLIFEDRAGYGRSAAGKGKKVLVEYSAPNTNKPQHLGHIRNNALGISITRLLNAIGYRATPVNLVNDRGIHICKSMLAYQMFGKGKTPEEADRKGDHFVGDFYVRYAEEEAKEFEAWKKGRTPKNHGTETRDEQDEETAFIKESKLYARTQEMLRKWEAGDPEIRALWETMNGWVFEGFDATYRRLGCRFEKVYLENETYRLGKTLVAAGLEKGVFYRKEDGSIWVDLTEEGLDPKVLLRGDGTSVYITQDLGTSKLKFDDFTMDRALWIVGDEQIYHFKVLFAVLKKLGFSWADGCYHLAYGMVDLPEGKMKSRQGTVVDADDLMDRLHQMELEEIKSRQLPIPEDALWQTAEILAQGALKFFILKFVPKTRMTFDPKASISPEGFTGPYVQYACVRIQSIFRKAGSPDNALDSLDLPTPEVLGLLTRPEEAAVLRRLSVFPDEVLASAESYNPARLCACLFEIARDYNRFYHNLPVLAAGDPDLQAARLALSAATALVLKKGLALLGIEVPERM